MLLALDTPQIILMAVGFGGMLVFLGIALWLLKRQPAANGLAAKRKVPSPRPVASAPAPVTDPLAFEPTMFASTAVSEADAPIHFEEPTDKTEFIPSGPPAERTEIVPPPPRWQERG